MLEFIVLLVFGVLAYFLAKFLLHLLFWATQHLISLLSDEGGSGLAKEAGGVPPPDSTTALPAGASLEEAFRAPVMTAAEFERSAPSQRTDRLTKRRQALARAALAAHTHQD